MKIAFHRYKLVFSTSSGLFSSTSRSGALLRFAFPDGSIGYADCHPWQEFGDEPLERQLALLGEHKTTRLTGRSLYFARKDAKARKEGVNLLKGLSVPRSHFLLMNSVNLDAFETAYEKGFRVFKVKMGGYSQHETSLLSEIGRLGLKNDVRFRFDFNARISPGEFESFVDRLPLPIGQIDFCEDPFPYCQESWKRIQESHRIALAFDHGPENAIKDGVAQVLILKSAVQDHELFLDVTSGQPGVLRRVVATSYLGHPLEQVQAAYIAAEVCQAEEVCGLLSHFAYEPNPFSECLQDLGPCFPHVPGLGFGFDEILENLDWKDI